MKMSKANIDDLISLSAAPRFRHVGQTFAENERTGKLEVIDKGGLHCDIFDTVLGEQYASVYIPGGMDEDVALSVAIEAAKKAQKPLTPAQKADAEARRGEVAAKDAQLAEANAEIERLRAELADKGGKKN